MDNDTDLSLIPESSSLYILLRLEYFGQPFGGWQRQGKIGQQQQQLQQEQKQRHQKTPLPSVQSTVEEAASSIIESLCNGDSHPFSSSSPSSFSPVVCVQVAGRTDKGVHALDQRCALRVPKTVLSDDGNDHCFDKFVLKMNEILIPRGVAILSCSPVPLPAQRFRVVKKRYCYVLQIPKRKILDQKKNAHVGVTNKTTILSQVSSSPPPPVKALHPFSRDLPRPLNMEKLNEVLKVFLGTHDCRHLSKQAGRCGGNTVRTILKSSCYVAKTATYTNDSVLKPPNFSKLPKLPWEEHMTGTHDFLILTFEANGFLWHQVRRMVNLAIKVAEGAIEPIDAAKVMGGMSEGPHAAPSRGLYLVKVWLENERDE